jgi:hypothetical protein
VIQRLPEIGLCAFSSIVVALPIAMLLNTFAATAGDAPSSKAATRIAAPAVLTPVADMKPAAPVDDGGEPVVEDQTEQTE